jgi:membrane associated rhomboid family serine protease
VSDSFPPQSPRRREPIFNIAPAVTALAVGLLAIHLLRQFFLSDDADTWVLIAFAFIPARELADVTLSALPGGDAARVWSLLTYAFLHANWTHVLVNVLWLVAFGSPLAWRFGTVRFLLFSAVGAVAGALTHFAFYPHDMTPLVGASAAISAHMAGISRFALGTRWGIGSNAAHMPALSLAETLRNPRVLAFIGIWFGVNLIFGITGAGTGVVSGAVAWDAHVGGFLAGLLLFALFDRG